MNTDKYRDRVAEIGVKLKSVSYDDDMVDQALEDIMEILERAEIEFSVNRFEVIDHTSEGDGRSYVKWVDDDFDVTLDLQDNARTLKVFLKQQLHGDRDD